MITPVCAVVALISGILHHSFLFTVYTVVAIGVLPFGVLAVSAWVGTLFPYHPMPLRYRWEHRRPGKRMLVRWSVLVVTPYVLVPMLASLMLVPSLPLWGFTAPHGLSEKLPDHDLGIGIAVACLIALAVSIGGQRLGGAIIERRRTKLRAFLSDPVRG
jgi:hypothetical protein